MSHISSDLIVTANAGSRVILCCQENLLARFEPPVPQTDSGVQVENTKEIERIVVKELGKMPP